MRPSSTTVRRRRSALGPCALAVVTVLIATLAGAPAAAAAPPAAVLVSPADGAVAAAAAPELAVAVTDPDGDPLEVAFEGRPKGATVSVPSTAEPFTIAAIPDIQNYTNATRAPMIAQQAQWIVDTRAQLNTQFAVQLGDLVGTWSWSGHWPFASNGLEVLDDNGMPNAVVPGNHDFDYVNDDHSQYDAWFPPSRYQNATWTPSTARYGGYMGQNQFGPDASDRANMNNYSLFTAGGVDWLVLGLEWEAPTPVLEWADRVLAAHPDRQVIMFTHAFLDLPGSRRTVPERPGGTTPEVMWQSFVRTHCQIRLVLNGHENDGDLGEANRTDANACGQPVHQILSDYQSRPNGGDGWLRYYRFDPAAATMTAVTYSPYLGRYETDADSSFTLPFPMTPPQPAPFTPIETVAAASGSTATTTWAQRTADTAYEWRVRVSDGSSTVTSPTWTVRTPGEPGVLGRDLFERSVASGWGTADAGGAWTTTSPARFRVAGGAGLMTLTTSTGLQAGLASVSSTRTRISAVLSVDKIADAHYVMLIGRQVGAEQYLLRLRIGSNGSAILHVMRGGTAVGAAFTVPGVTIVPGAKYRMVFDVAGTSPTTLAGKLWRDGTVEPASWQLTRTDSTSALQTAGTVGVHSRVSSAANAVPLTIAFDEIRVLDPTVTGPPPPPPPNQAPVAVFTSSATALAIAVDGRGSSDGDGTVASYAWSFGDGGTATGAQASRTYAAPGTYTVTLTVTDDDGATDVESAQVTVTAPPPPGVLAGDAFGRTVASGWGVADTGGSWSIVGTPARFAVAGGTGRVTLATSTEQHANLPSVSTTRSRMSAVFSVDKVAEAHYIWLVGRQVGAQQYMLRVRIDSDSSVILHVMRGGTAVGAGVTVPGLSVVAGQSYQVLFDVRGTSPTSLSGKIWRAGTSEPPAWQVVRSDSTAALQVPGSVGLRTWISSSANAYPLTVTIDDVVVTEP